MHVRAIKASWVDFSPQQCSYTYFHSFCWAGLCVKQCQVKSRTPVWQTSPHKPGSPTSSGVQANWKREKWKSEMLKCVCVCKKKGGLKKPNKSKMFFSMVKAWWFTARMLRMANLFVCKLYCPALIKSIRVALEVHQYCVRKATPPRSFIFRFVFQKQTEKRF